MFVNTSAFDSYLGVNRRNSPPACEVFSSHQDRDADATMRLTKYQASSQLEIWENHAGYLAVDLEPFGPQYDILVRVLLADYPEVFE